MDGQSMTYILIDTANMFFRARHVARGDIDMKLGMCFHIMLNSVRKTWREFNGAHVVFCLEGRSWRKDFYEPYKKNRQAARDALTPREQEEDKIFWESYQDFSEYLDSKTNCTVLQQQDSEADDMIALWIALHPNDSHIIVSSDSDFYQLLASNVRQYNGITNQVITIEPVYST